MRLTSVRIDTIQSTVHAVLGEGAQVTLFGSREDDSLKGGDVDLRLEVQQGIEDLEQPIYRIATQEGIRL